MEIVTEIDPYKIIEYPKANIFIIENILDDSFCEEIINVIDVIPKQKSIYTKGNNVECFVNNIDHLINQNDDFYYSFSTDINEYENIIQKLKSTQRISTNKNNGITKDQLMLHKEKINDYMNKIHEIMQKINSQIELQYNSGYLLRKIHGKTRLHKDGMNEIMESNITFIKNNLKGDYHMVRNASVIFALNDNHDGGHFIFPYFNIDIKLKKGSVIIFPPYWTHEHGTTDLENHTYRYTITTWCCEKI